MIKQNLAKHSMTILEVSNKKVRCGRCQTITLNVRPLPSALPQKGNPLLATEWPLTQNNAETEQSQ